MVIEQKSLSIRICLGFNFSIYYRRRCTISNASCITFELEGKYIFPNNTVKQDIVSEYKPAGYNIDNLNYELLGFNITASDIKMHINPTKIDDIKTRVNIPLLLAKNVNVSNGGLINLSYKEVDLGSV